jgi:hypothetical protein
MNPDDSQLRQYAGYCGPKAYAAIVETDLIDAAIDLTLAHLEAGFELPVDGTYDYAMVQALKSAGVEIVATTHPQRPEEEWIDRGMPQNFGYWGGDYREEAYVETRYTLAQWQRLPEAKAGLFLLVIGSYSNAHYVVVEDGEVISGQLNFGSIARRRVNCVHALKRSGS